MIPQNSVDLDLNNASQITNEHHSNETAESEKNGRLHVIQTNKQE